MACVAQLAAISLTGAAIVAGCSATEETQQQQPIDWQVSWEPVTSYEDDRPLEERPLYEVQMAEAGSDNWTPVWTGAATQTTIYAPPGRRCFRTIAVQKGHRSEASETVCLTKHADKSPMRSASGE